MSLFLPPQHGPHFSGTVCVPFLFLLPFSQSVPLTPSNGNGPHIPVPQQVCKSGLMNQDIPMTPKTASVKDKGPVRFSALLIFNKLLRKGHSSPVEDVKTV